MPSPPCRYRLLALDLDGTVLDPSGQVTPATRAAVQRARAAGVRVVICTGRGLVECRPALEALGQTDPVIVAGGALIADPQTSRTIDRFGIDPALVRATVTALHQHHYPALVLKDPQAAGYDYLVLGAQRFPLDPIINWWFAEMKIGVRYADSVADDPHPEHTVRVGACGLAARMADIKRDLVALFRDAAIVHHFPAVVAPGAEYGVAHVLEVFEKRANKWDAIRHLAAGWQIDAAQIAAIGDEINDIAMLKGAGLGIAMENAVPAVKDVARCHTAANSADGVAAAITKILSGEW